MDTPAFSVADAHVIQRASGVTPPVKVGIVLALAGVMSVYGFATLDLGTAKDVEARHAEPADRTP